MPIGRFALRVAGFLGCGGHDVEADEGEEDHGGRGEDPGEPEDAGFQPEQRLDQRQVQGPARGRRRGAGRRNERRPVGER